MANTGTAYLKLPPLRLVWNRSIGSNILSLPLLNVSGLGLNAGVFVSLSLPRLLVQASGLHGIAGETSNNLLLPRLTVQSSGLRGIIGETSNPLLLPLLHVLAGGGGRTGSAALKLGLLRLVSSGIKGLAGSATLQLPLLNVVSGAYFVSKGSAILSLPLLRVIGSGEGLLEVKPLGLPIRKGFAMNLVNWAITEYEDYPFNSFAYFNGLQLGAHEGMGICVLDGPDDAGQDILAYIEGGTEDLFKKFMSRLREAWIESRQDGPLVLKVIMGEEETSPVAELPIESSGRHMHEERVKFPRGLKGRFASFRLENVAGSDVDIKRIKIFLEEVQRRR
jgi:hypothetical protein